MGGEGERTEDLVAVEGLVGHDCGVDLFVNMTGMDLSICRAAR